MKPRKLSKRRLPAWRNRLWFYRLRKLGACEEAVVAHRRFRTFRAAWDKCERGDWMLWIAARAGLCSKNELVLAACACARTALPYTKDPRVLKCIEAAEVWARGESVTLEQVHVGVRDAATAAASAATADAYAAAYAASADAATAAADAATAAANVALNKSADIVRTIAASGGWKMTLPARPL